MKKKIVLESILCLLLLLFVYTAISKLKSGYTFEWMLSKSPLLRPFAHFLAIGLPMAELMLSLLLFLPITQRIGLISAFVVLNIFTLYIGYMVLFTPKLPCTCGGVIASMSWTQHFLFNIAFIVLTGIAIKFSKKIQPQILKQEVDYL